MSLDKNRLKGKIKQAMEVEVLETENPETSRDRIADALATAIVDEIKQLTINYIGGLSASTYPVAGTMQHSVS